MENRSPVSESADHLPKNAVKGQFTHYPAAVLTTPLFIATISALGVVAASGIAWHSNRSNIRAAGVRESHLQRQLAEQQEQERADRVTDRELAAGEVAAARRHELDKLSDQRASSHREQEMQRRRAAYRSALTTMSTGVASFDRQRGMGSTDPTTLMLRTQTALDAIRAEIDLHAGEDARDSFLLAAACLDELWWKRRKELERPEEAVPRKEVIDARLRANDAIEKFRVAARRDLELNSP